MVDTLLPPNDMGCDADVIELPDTFKVPIVALGVDNDVTAVTVVPFTSPALLYMTAFPSFTVPADAVFNNSNSAAVVDKDVNLLISLSKAVTVVNLLI